MSVARWIVTGLALCLLGAPLVIAVAALSGVGHRWVDILAQFTAPAFVAVLLLAVGLLAARLWLAGGAAVVVGLVSLFAVWPQWSPARATPRPDAPTISIYSANLYVGNTDAKAMTASIKAADADIIVLIEMSHEAATQVDTVLAGYPNRVAMPSLERPHRDRNVIASRFPLKAMHSPTRIPGLSHMIALVDTPLGPIEVVAVHLTRPWPYQYQWGQITQAMSLAQVVAGADTPVVVAGDFNSVSSARIGKQIQNDIGLIPAPGWPGTWPSALPAPLGITIDQVYSSPELAFVGRRVGRRNGSDHRPVITRLTLAEPAKAP